MKGTNKSGLCSHFFSQLAASTGQASITGFIVVAISKSFTLANIRMARGFTRMLRSADQRGFFIIKIRVNPRAVEENFHTFVVSVFR